jgi:hypothetical protein
MAPRRHRRGGRGCLWAWRGRRRSPDWMAPAAGTCRPRPRAPAQAAAAPATAARPAPPRALAPSGGWRPRRAAPAAGRRCQAGTLPAEEEECSACWWVRAAVARRRAGRTPVRPWGKRNGRVRARGVASGSRESSALSRRVRYFLALFVSCVRPRRRPGGGRASARLGSVLLSAACG